MTKSRIDLLNVLITSDTIADASRELGISESAARQRLHGLKSAYREAVTDIQEYRTYRMKMKARFL